MEEFYNLYLLHLFSLLALFTGTHSELTQFAWCRTIYFYIESYVRYHT